MTPKSRREFLRDLGVRAAALPFIANLPSLGFANGTARKQRLVFVFSPNGIVPSHFWPDSEGKEFALKSIVQPLEPFRNRTLMLKGVCDKVRGDGDNHMRGIGCLLTGTELFPGNIQGGSDTPAGWSSGVSIDQELKAYLQKSPVTKTRFGSLEFGVNVPEVANTWTRMVYAGPNKPIAPIDNPYRMFAKLYGRAKDRENLKSVLDAVQADLKTVRAAAGNEDRRLIDDHAALVREMELELRESAREEAGHAVPPVEPGVKVSNDTMPRVSTLQLDMLAAALANDFTRIATFQITASVGQARMNWLGISEDHHNISHKPDSDTDAVEKLVKINRWYCEQVAYLAKKLADTPEPGGPGSVLDNTTIVWTNELGQGNSHTLDNIPFVLVGGGLGFEMGRSLKFPKVPHNRLLLSLAHGFGHTLPKFGNPDYCGDGPLSLS